MFQQFEQDFVSRRTRGGIVLKSLFKDVQDCLWNDDVDISVSLLPPTVFK